MTQAVMINGIRVQPDDPASMWAGWETVERMANKLCWDHVYIFGLRNGLTFDDLMQEAYLQYDRVIRTYDSNVSDNIITYLKCTIRDYLKFIYDRNDKNRTLDEAISIDKRHYDDDGNKVKESEFIPGGDSREEAEDALEAEELAGALQKAIGKLSNADKQTLQAIKNGEKVPAASKQKALKAARLAILSADEDTKEIIRAYAPYI